MNKRLSEAPWLPLQTLDIEVKALAAHVLRSYRLEPITGQPPEQFGFTSTVVKNGMPMRVLAHRRPVHRAA